LFADEFRAWLAERERRKERGGIGHAIDPALELPDRDAELLELRLVLLVAVRGIDERLVACDAEDQIAVPGLRVIKRLPDEVSAGNQVERDRRHLVLLVDEIVAAIATALHHDDRFISLLVAVAFRAIVTLETPAVAERRDCVRGRKFRRFGDEAAGEEDACRQGGEDGHSRRHKFARTIAEPTAYA